MNVFRVLCIALVVSLLCSSCSVWEKIFPPKYGCPTNGKNIGAEKVLDGDKQTQKTLKKTKKFRNNKF